MTIQWDQDHRLVGADITSGSSTQEVRYRYEPTGIRVSSLLDGDETRYLIDTVQPYAQVLEESGSESVAYVYGQRLISQKRGAERSIYHADGLGRIRSLSNGLGDLENQYSYDVFGNGILVGVANLYRFTGEQLDLQLNNTYLRNHYYIVITNSNETFPDSSLLI